MYFKRLLDPTTIAYSYNDNGDSMTILEPYHSIYISQEKGFFIKKDVEDINDQKVTYEGKVIRIKEKNMLLSELEADFEVILHYDKICTPMIKKDNGETYTIRSFYNYSNQQTLEEIAKKVTNMILASLKSYNPVYSTNNYDVTKCMSGVIGKNNIMISPEDEVKAIYTVVYCLSYFFQKDRLESGSNGVPSYIYSNLDTLDNYFEDTSDNFKKMVKATIKFIWDKVDNTAYDITVRSLKEIPLKKTIAVALSKLDDLYAMYNYMVGGEKLNAYEISLIENFITPSIVREDTFLKVLSVLSDSDLNEALIAFQSMMNIEEDDGKKYILGLLIDSIKSHIKIILNLCPVVNCQSIEEFIGSGTDYMGFYNTVSTAIMQVETKYNNIRVPNALPQGIEADEIHKLFEFLVVYDKGSVRYNTYFDILQIPTKQTLVDGNGNQRVEETITYGFPNGFTEMPEIYNTVIRNLWQTADKYRNKILNFAQIQSKNPGFIRFHFQLETSHVIEARNRRESKEREGIDWF